MPPEPSRRQERLQRSADFRAAGRTWVEIAEDFRLRYNVNARVAFRFAHGWSQRTAADEWNGRWPDDLKTFKNISSWELWPITGHMPSLDVLGRLAELYECRLADLLGDCADFRDRDTSHVEPGGELVTTARTPVFNGQAHSYQPDAPALPFLGQLDAISKLSWDDLRSPRQRETAYEQLVQFLIGWARTMKRREVLQILGWAATAAATAPIFDGLNLDERERMVQTLQAPSRVDAQVIGHIEDTLWHCIRQDDALGAHATLDVVLAQRSLVRAIVPECPDTLRSRLLSLASNLSLQAGWLAYDLGEFDSAAYYYEHARTTAHEAEDNRLGALVLCTMSQLATWQAKPRVGTDHAVAAQNWARQTRDRALQAYACDVAARSYAAAGERSSCLKELAQAESHLEAAADQTADQSRLYFYTAGQLAGTKGLCHLRLGQPKPAVTAARQALALVDGSFVRNLAFTKLYLGTAYIQAGELEEGTRLLGDTAGLATRNQSVRLIGQLLETRQQLQPWEDARPVRELDERLVAYGLSGRT